MTKEKEIPFKNYIFLGIILLFTILVLIYFYKLHAKYEEENANISIMNKYMQVINYNELDSFIIENKDAVIYMSKLGNKKIRNFEIEFKKVIIDNSLKNEILYLDMTNIVKDNDKYQNFINKYKSKDSINIEIPSLIIFKNSKIEKVYNIKENNYNIEKITEYLIEEEIIK